MASIDVAGLDIGRLTDPLGRAQAEIASRDKRHRKDLRSGRERRLTAEGYKLSDTFSELGTGSMEDSRT